VFVFMCLCVDIGVSCVFVCLYVCFFVRLCVYNDESTNTNAHWGGTPTHTHYIHTDVSAEQTESWYNTFCIFKSFNSLNTMFQTTQNPHTHTHTPPPTHTHTHTHTKAHTFRHTHAHTHTQTTHSSDTQRVCTQGSHRTHNNNNQILTTHMRQLTRANPHATNKNSLRVWCVCVCGCVWVHTCSIQPHHETFVKQTSHRLVVLLSYGIFYKMIVAWLIRSLLQLCQH